MKAIRIEQHGEADVLKLVEGIDEPAPKEGQAIVRIRAAGVNFVDIYQRRGFYPTPLPYIPGLEAAGTVEALGKGVEGISASDRVAYTGHLGSYSEYTAIDADHLIKLPEGLSFEEGAAVPLQGMTAHYLIHEFRRPGTGDTVLIHAAAGGVGLLLVQWAKRLGATVIGTVSTDEKARAAKQAGADHVILYTKEDFVEATKRLTGGQGADLVLDGVGKSTLPGSLEASAVRGQIVIFGSASGAADPVSPRLLMTKSVRLAGGSLGNFTATRAELLERSGAVLEGIREGWLKLRIDRVMQLKDAAEAHRSLEERRTIGKIVLKT